MSEQKKPREWWIAEVIMATTRQGGITEYRCFDSEMEHPKANIHVVEYAHVQKLEQELVELKSDRKNMIQAMPDGTYKPLFHKELEAELAEAKAELADCIKTHDENIGVLKSFQDLLKAAKNEIYQLKQLSDDYDRALVDDRDRWKEQAMKLAEALKEISGLASLDACMNAIGIAKPVLAEFEKFKGEMG